MKPTLTFIICCIAASVNAQWKLVEYFPSGTDTIYINSRLEIWKSKLKMIEAKIDTNNYNLSWIYNLKSKIYLKSCK